MKAPDAILGRWRITEMEVWPEDALDLLGPAFIEFGPEGMGEFTFCAVEGSLDGRYSIREGQPFVEFSWDGEDDGDPTSGRGWATVQLDGTLAGHIYIHHGDDSGFVAKRS